MGSREDGEEHEAGEDKMAYEAFEEDERSCPAEDADQEELAACATLAQAKAELDGKRKGEGKGKHRKGKKGPDGSLPSAGSSQDYKAPGTIVSTEQQKA